MIGLLQRVDNAQVDVDGECVAQIDRGLLVLVGVEKKDQKTNADRLLERLLGYRLFPDEAGRMNLSLNDIQGGLLLVPQFTLAADTRKGNRPGFSTAADPKRGRELFDYLIEQAHHHHGQTESGVFGAHMKVSLLNDGPVTFWLEG